MNGDIQRLLTILVVIMGMAALLGLVLLVLIHRKLRRIAVPAHVGFATTLRMVPLSLCIALDLLDFAFDIFATPIVWIVLSRYRLQALRNVATLEALVPFTQILPTFTAAWAAVRLLNLGEPPSAREFLDSDEVAPGRYVPRIGRH